MALQESGDQVRVACTGNLWQSSMVSELGSTPRVHGIYACPKFELVAPGCLDLVRRHVCWYASLRSWTESTLPHLDV